MQDDPSHDEDELVKLKQKLTDRAMQYLKAQGVEVEEAFAQKGKGKGSKGK